LEMGTFTQLEDGRVYISPWLTVTEEHAGAVTELGGYTLRLFTDPEYRAERWARPILPGGMLLFLAGGLAEQTGIFDETTLALVGYGEVSFKTPAMVGDVIALEMTVALREDRGTRGVMTMSWRLVTNKHAELATAFPIFIFDTAESDRPDGK
jgi:acyl dehydratase